MVYPNSLSGFDCSPARTRFETVRTGDFDGNGLDVAIFGLRSARLYFTSYDRVNRSVTFSEISFPIGTGSADVPTKDIVLGDVDGDGRTEILLPNQSKLYRWTTGLVTETLTGNYGAGGTQQPVGMLDLNGDGKEELLAVRALTGGRELCRVSL